jgi:hypothetical protein
VSARHGGEHQQTWNRGGDDNGLLTSGLRGGAATAAGGEAWEVLLGVLHDEEKMRSAPRYENGDGEHLAQGSPKRGDMRRRYGDAAALRYSSGGTYGSVSSSSEQGCS